MPKTWNDCHYSAVILHGLIEAIDHLDNEGRWDSMTCVITAARQHARALIEDLDDLDLASRKQKAEGAAA